jgi:hypothetical protein
MSGNLCKNGHQSDTDDYCSVCGVAMAPSASLAPTTSPSAASATICPDCGTRRSDPDARYCEVCRHDFETGAAGSVAAAPAPAVGPGLTTPPPPAAPAPVASLAAPVVEVSARTWEAIVVVDPSLDVDPDPQLPCPTDEPERSFPIDLPQLLIGRRDDRRDIRPEIPVRDPAVSHRHAHLLRSADGSVAIRDLASTNGTFVNGNEIPPGTSFVLSEGDVITLGRWTKITLRRG